MTLPRIAALALICAAVGPASASPTPSAPPPEPPITSAYVSPRVWIFCGTPGDEEHHIEYEKMLTRLRAVLTTRFGIPATDLTVLYGPVEAGYDGECTREALLAELGKIVVHTQAADAAPVWIIFLGHANAIAGGAFFNLPGPDLSTRELGEALRGANPATPLVVLATTACSAAFLRPLSGPGRIIATATSTSDAENETDYPEALTDALESPDTDTNHDGYLSVTELFLACHHRVETGYKGKDLMVTEHSTLDGDGDGRGTQRPSDIDATPASHIGLRITSGKGAKSNFD